MRDMETTKESQIPKEKDAKDKEANKKDNYVTQEKYDAIAKELEELKQSLKPKDEPIEGTVQEPKKIITALDRQQPERLLTYDEQEIEYSKSAKAKREQFLQNLKGGNLSVEKNEFTQRLLMECIILESLKNKPQLIKSFGEGLYKDLQECRYSKILERIVEGDNQMQRYASLTFGHNQFDRSDFGKNSKTFQHVNRNIQVEKLRLMGYDL